MYNWFSSNKCFYCYRKNHVFKRQCSNFQNDMLSNWIHFYEKKLYLKFFRKKKTFHIRIWIDRNQHDCVIIFEKFNKIIFLSALIFAQFNTTEQLTFLFVLQFKFRFVAFAKNNVNTINKKNKTIKKSFTNKK